MPAPALRLQPVALQAALPSSRPYAPPEIKVGRSTQQQLFGSRVLSWRLTHPGQRRQASSSLRFVALQTTRKNLKWVLESVGDGDCKHLDQPVPRPSSFELTSDYATVGREAEKVDIIIPVATVSGLHARLERKGETLYVTDLDSTNGTFVDYKRLRPGAVSLVPPGSYIVFGDQHLAVFQFLQKEEEPSVSDLEMDDMRQTSDTVQESPSLQ